MTKIPILLYHSVSVDPPGWIADLTVTPRAFSDQMDLIVASGRTPVTVSALRTALEGETVLPRRPVVVTFDDGFADFAAAAVTLADRRIPSTLYVTTGALAGRGPKPANMVLPPAAMLNWSQLADLEDHGVEIGGHTHTHPQLDTLGRREAAVEIRHCKQLLEDEIGHEIGSFAYPYGYSSASVRRSVEAAGYRSACAVMNALSSGSDRAFSLARLMVHASTTPGEVAAWLDETGAATAPYPERMRTRAWRAYRRLRSTDVARRVTGTGAPEQPGVRSRS